MFESIMKGILIGSVAVAGMAAIVSTTDIPDVHFSYSTDKCVEVINYTDETYSCENLPAKFNHVWVQ